MLIGAVIVSLLCGCHSMKDCGCLPMPALPLPASNHRIEKASMVIDLTNTRDWEHRTTYTYIALLDSGEIFGVFKGARIDTFSLDFPPCAALDSIHLDWERVLSKTNAVQPVRSDVYCDSVHNRIGIVEQIIKSGGSYHRLIRAHRMVNGLVVELQCETGQPASMGPSPPEMRLQVLRWMSDIRSMEK